MGDGDCEAWYIQMLKRNEPLTHVDLKPEFPQKKALSELYEQVIELSNDYDEVYWLVDMDVILKETKEAKAGEKTRLQEFEEYCEKIEKINEEYKKKYAVDNDLIKIIINNPGFEYWLLLHFKNTTKYYTSCDEVIKEFKSYQEISDYKKSRKYYTKQDNDILATTWAELTRNGVEINIIQYYHRCEYLW